MEEIIIKAFRRSDNDAQFHFLGCLCAMRNEGEENLDGLIETLTEEIFKCPCIWPDEDCLMREIDLACEENYFAVKSLN